MLRRKLSDLKWWVKYRTTERYNVIKLRDLPPAYYEPEDRMFHGMMQILCDFVEVELAWCHEHVRGRSRERGLAHLDWEIGLKLDESCGVNPDEERYGQPSSQAIAAAEVKTIYLWYRDVFQKRKDSMDETGCFEAWKKRKDSPEAYAEWERLCAVDYQLDEDRHAEDAAYMKRLVDIRRSMWT